VKGWQHHTMAELSLSTAWSKDRYKQMGEFVKDAREFGYSQIELYSNLTADQLSELLGIGGIVISSVHCPCPARPSPSGLQKADLSLSTLSTKARSKAVEEAKLTIELASRIGAKAVILHTGHVKIDVSLFVKMRQLYQQGGAASNEYEEIKKWLIKERSSKAKDHLQAAEESLRILVDCAVKKGVVLGLENRVNYHEIPSLEEMEYFLIAFEGKPIGYWHDLGHAEVQDRLGFCSHNEWLSRFGSRMIGVHLHDVRGIDDHYAPGIGDLDWDLVARNIPKDAIRVCELANWNTPENVAGAVTFLRSKGILHDAAQE
jgi:sugar phosphate isomerase/epimerase